MQAHYRGRLFKVFIINMPMLGYAVWKVVSNFISQYTLDKIQVDRNSLDALHSKVSLEELENKYGGKRINIVDNFFPPLVLKQ